MYPLNDDNVIAGVKTAREITCGLRLPFNSSKFRWRKMRRFQKKNIKGKTDARCDALYRADVKACFAISDSPGGKICGRYRKKTFLNVSRIILLTEECVLKVINEAHPKNTQTYFITARGKSAQSKGRPPKKGFPLTKGVPGCFEMDSIQ